MSEWTFTGTPTGNDPFRGPLILETHGVARGLKSAGTQSPRAPVSHVGLQALLQGWVASKQPEANEAFEGEAGLVRWQANILLYGACLKQGRLSGKPLMSCCNRRIDLTNPILRSAQHNDLTRPNGAHSHGTDPQAPHVSHGLSD